MDRKIGNNIYVVRGVGAILIIIYHFSVYYQETFGKLHIEFNFAYLTFPIPMFFLLSAFFLYPKAKEIKSFINLIIYRMQRLYPMYWIAVIFSSLIRTMGNENISFVRILCNLTMIEDVFGVEQIDGAYWTMFYELMLLLILALCCVVKINKVKLIERPVYLCYIWLILGTMGCFLMKILQIDSSSMSVLMLGSRYIPMFVIGILFYERYIKNNISTKPFVGLLIYCGLFQIFFNSWIQSIYSYVAVLICWIIISGKVKNNLLFNNKVLIYLGRISYNIYLTHNQFGRICIASLGVIVIVGRQP